MLTSKQREAFKALANLICSGSRESAQKEIAQALEKAFNEGYQAAFPLARVAALRESISISLGEEQAARSRRVLFEKEIKDLEEK